MGEQRIGALVLAAGLSSRMEVFKPLLEIGGRKLVEHAIELFLGAGVENIVTVTGHRAEELIPVVEAASSRAVINRNYKDGMFSSIQRGVVELNGTCDAFFLLPVDIPFVRAATIGRLREVFGRDPSVLVCCPQYQGRRGHPPLIDSSLIPQVLAYEGEGGMRGLLGRHEGHSVAVPVDDPFIRWDVDTPDDLLRLKAEISKRSS